MQWEWLGAQVGIQSFGTTYHLGLVYCGGRPSTGRRWWSEMVSRSVVGNLVGPTIEKLKF